MTERICCKLALPVACSISGRSLSKSYHFEKELYKFCWNCHFECVGSNFCQISPANIPLIEPSAWCTTETILHILLHELSYHAYHQCPISSKLCSPYTTCSTNWSLIRKPQKATSITPAAKNAWKATPTTVLFEGPTISIAETWNKKVCFCGFINVDIEIFFAST